MQRTVASLAVRCLERILLRGGARGTARAHTSSGRLVALLVLVAVAALAACAPGANPLAQHASSNGAPAGFLLGLWHGVIVWVTFLVSLFDRRVSVYEVHNTGWAYNLGFVIGAAGLHGGGGAAARRRANGSAPACPAA